MVYASDALVAQLEDHGYGGKRPGSAAEARELLRLYKKLGVTHTMIDQAADLPDTERKKRANDLFDKLEAGLDDALRHGSKHDRKQMQRNAAVFQDRLLRLLSPQR